MERFLYRLSRSSHKSQFLLKGALLLRVWNPATYRSTRDIDLLGQLSNDVDTMVKVIRAVCRENVEPDGLEFDADTAIGETIVEDGDYHGVRVKFLGHLGNARADMQVDAGFGDAVTPAPCQIHYPVLLKFPSPQLAAYPPESTIAEKFEVMLKRGTANSRMKDYHDIWWLSRTREFDGEVLARAIQATCERRGTPIVEGPAAITATFGSETTKMAQWRAFRNRVVPTDSPEEFAEVVATVARFIGPVATAIVRESAFSSTWMPGGPWKSMT